MKHFIGGWAAGTFLGLIGLEAGEDKPLGVSLLGILGGLVAWGLLP